MEPTPKDATTNIPKTATMEEILQLLESLVDTTLALESGQEKLTEALDEVKGDTEELLNQLESISFKVDYPGLGDV